MVSDFLFTQAGARHSNSTISPCAVNRADQKGKNLTHAISVKMRADRHQSEHPSVQAIAASLSFSHMPKMTPGYVDGFVFVVPKKNVAAYKKMARMGAAAWKKFGALEYFECMGDDLKPKGGNGMPPVPSFITLKKATPSETVWFSFITFKNKKHRDAVNKKVMAYFGKQYADMKDASMPFDIQRMSYGGFKTIIYK